MGNQGKHIKRKEGASKKKGLKNTILTLLIFFFIILIVASGLQIYKWYNNNQKNKEILNEIKSENIIVYDEAEDEVAVDFDALKKINSDVVGYVEVNNTNISYPVVKATDNNYYLTHNLKKEYNGSGWVFMDYRNDLDGKDKNIIIYGHNMRDGSMFGSLKEILSANWYKNEENKYITFITEGGTSVYEVFSVYQVEKEDYYITTGFSNNEEYEGFLKTIKDRSIYNFGTEPSVDDTILTLSTCANDNTYRVVLHAKKVNIDVKKSSS